MLAHFLIGILICSWQIVRPGELQSPFFSCQTARAVHLDRIKSVKAYMQIHTVKHHIYIKPHTNSKSLPISLINYTVITNTSFEINI